MSGLQFLNVGQWIFYNVQCVDCNVNNIKPIAPKQLHYSQFLPTAYVLFIE
jgi:hypothetical protein